jgi:hypothetical protein
MTLQKIALGMVATVASLALTPAVQADTHIAVSGFGATVGTPDGGIGFWIGGSAPQRHYYHGPVYRGYGRPWHDRFGPPPVVVVRPPVMVQPAPPIMMEPAPPVIQDSTVTVWITNSNGSRTTVQLTRRNGWYVGPRGEYYDQMPTNEQLRLAYGF